MLTKSDLRLIKKLILDTNEDLIEAFGKIHSETKKELGDKIINFKDQILFEIKKLREDVATVTGYKDQIEDHETRIGKLEEVLQPKTS